VVSTKLTQGFVDGAKAAPGADRTRYWDESLPGFALVVTAAGHKSFCVKYRAGGRQRLMIIKGVLKVADARREAKAFLGVVAKGGDPLGERRKAEMSVANSLKAICEEYLEREGGMRRDAEGRAMFKGTKLRTGQERLATFERLVYPKLGGMQVDDIKCTDIVRLLDKIEDERGSSMADHTLAYLRRVFTWHASRSDDFRSPIVRGMARTKPRERTRERLLTDDELRAVWKTAETQGNAFGAFVRFTLLTATRRNESAHMRFSEVSGADWTIPAERYKSGTDHLIPLSSMARAVLTNITRIKGCDFLFTTDGKRPIGGFSKFKGKFDSACGVTGWTIHDLRRTARSLMSRAGVDADIAERCLGHVIAGVRGTYDRHGYRDEKARAFEVLAAQIERIVNPQPAVVPFRAKAQNH
jgi:integrase